MKVRTLPHLLLISTLLLFMLHLSLQHAAATNLAAVNATTTTLFESSPAAGPATQTITESIPTDAGKPPFTGGQILTQPPVYATQTDRAMQDQPLDAMGIEAAPVITIWYGLEQSFGEIGQPLPWVNILGNVTDDNKVTSLVYTLNGSAPRALGIGPDKRRLAQLGDFNVELDINELNDGPNTVIITATDRLGEQSSETVTVNYTSGTTWPLPYTADWSSAQSISDIAQIVDGQWELQAGGTIHPTWLDYDRLVAIGDQSWTDYEVTVPITINALDPSGYPWPSSGPGIGLLLRWPGHYQENNEQPYTGWRKLGALGWFRWNRDNNGVDTAGLQMIGYFNSVLDTNASIVPQFGLPYIMKMQVESAATADEGAWYRYKVWPAAESEPAGWQLVGQNDKLGASSGSLLLVAHHIDASIGTVEVRPLNNEAERVTLQTNTTGTGSIAVSPQQDDYAQGTVVMVTAQPGPNMEFTGWSGDLTGSANPASLTLNRNTSITAAFAPRSYTLQTNTTGQGNITIDPILTTYPHGTVVTLTAQPANGWSFANWTGDVSSSAVTLQLTMDGNKAVTANFNEVLPNTYPLNTTVVGQGTVTRAPDQALYEENTIVTLTAQPTTGWEFTGWSGDLAGMSNPINITMSAARAVTATFAQSSYSVKVIINGNGNVQRDPDLTSYPYGTVVALTAVTNPGWRFAGWQGALAGSAISGTLVVDSEEVITATFVEEQGTDVNLLAVAGAGGMVDVEPVLESYPLGTVVTVTAVPTAGWRFIGWVGDVEGTANPLVLTLAEDLAFQAQFVQDLARFSTAVDGGGTISSSLPPGTYPVGTVITLTANPAPDSQFLGWEGAVQSTVAEITVVLNGDRHVVAHFGPAMHTVTIAVDGEGTVTPTSGTYQHNQTIELTATANTGSTFVGWSGSIESTTNPLSLTVTDDLTITAHFTDTISGTGSHSLYLPLVMR